MALDFFNLISIIIAVIFFGILLTGFYYSVVFTQDFKNKTQGEKAAGISITLLTVIFSMVYFYIYVLPSFSKKIFIVNPQ